VDVSRPLAVISDTNSPTPSVPPPGSAAEMEA